MGDRWGAERPPDEAYERVTRDLFEVFAGLHAGVAAIVDRLDRSYDVVRRPATAAELKPFTGAVAGTVLTPATPGTTDLLVAYVVADDCPDVRFGYGPYWRAGCVVCGCDACDEDLADAVGAAEDALYGVASGLTEWVRWSDGGAEIGAEYGSGLGSHVSWLEPEEARAEGYLTDERREWSPWRHRDLPPGIEVVPYTHPDVDRLVAELQQEYVVRYGGVDTTPIHPLELMPPDGLFLLAYDGDQPVAMGGWRVHVEERSGRVPGERAAEIKRMYVVDAARGRGFARRVLAALERTAAAAGCDLMVLETGEAQPEAIALYRSAGYTPIPPFGHYTDSDQSVHLAKPLGAAAADRQSPSAGSSGAKPG